MALQLEGDKMTGTAEGLSIGAIVISIAAILIAILM
jgi:hypothetical protein